MAGFTYNETSTEEPVKGFSYGDTDTTEKPPAPSDAPVLPEGHRIVHTTPEARPVIVNAEGIPQGFYNEPAPILPSQNEYAKGRYEEYPTIGSMPLEHTGSFKQGAKFVAGMGVTSDPEGKENLIRQNVPDAKFSYDKYGNRLVEVGGQKYHVNRPGLTTEDVSSTALKGALAAPVAMGAAALAPAGSPLIATALQGGAGALSNLGEQYLSGEAGSGKTIDPSEVASSAVFSMLPTGVVEGGKSLVNMMKPDVFSQLGRGAQNWLKQTAEELQLSKIKPPSGAGSDMILDNPYMKETALAVAKSDPAAAEALLAQINARQAATPMRVAADVDRHLGQMHISERELANELKGYHSVYNKELKPLLDNSPPIDPSSIVQNIDSMLPQAKGDVERTLKDIRRQLVNESGTAGTPAQRVKQGAIYQTTPAVPGTPPVLETSAQGLENVRTYIDRTIKFGNEYLKPTQAANANITEIRNQLSDMLKKQVPGYEDVMGKFRGNYAMFEANEAGANLFSKGTNGTRLDDVEKYLNNPDPNVQRAFKIGARASVENRISEAPSELAGLKRVQGSPTGVQRQNLDRLFGQKNVDNLVKAAEREAAYQQTAQEFENAATSARSKVGERAASIGTKPLLSNEPVKQTYSSLVQNPVNATANFLKGTSGTQFPQDQAKFLTARAGQMPEYLRGFNESVERDALAKRLGAAGSAAIQGAAPFARGGAVLDHEAEADKLVRAAEREKNNVNKTTEGLLNVDDNTIAHALDVAQAAI